MRQVLCCCGLIASLTAATGLLAAEPDYQAAQWDPIHVKPAIDGATDQQCLACHQEILDRKVLVEAPAGIKTAGALAWYQTLDTYDGDQETFHRRHVLTPLAAEVMSLRCTFCHQGSDPREEAPGASATAAAVGSDAGFTLRKVVDPEKTCLMCHGSFPYEVMELEGPWHQVRGDLEDEEIPNGCLSCHEELFRTVRHNVNYLKAEAIEQAAAESSDLCYGCHGGRAWYRISYPYPRHPWPDMPEETPDWAKGRPIKSDPRHLISGE